MLSAIRRHKARIFARAALDNDSSGSLIIMATTITNAPWRNSRLPDAACRMSPRPDPEGFGSIQRRQGKWAESTANLEKAATLDPKNISVLINLCFSYVALRNFETADKVIDRSITASPDSFQPRALKGFMKVLWKGDLSAAKEVFSSVPAETDPNGLMTWAQAWMLTLERKYPDALRALEQYRGETMFLPPRPPPRRLTSKA